MAKSTEVAKTSSTTDLTTVDPAVEALLAAQAGEFGEESLQVPILKVGQAMTREVRDDQAEVGEFIDTLAGEGLGDKIEFVIAYYQRGRAASDQDTNRYYTAFEDTIPERWSDLVGEEFVGQRFDEHPDAEETYKKRVNAKEIEWGRGPLISTTHNYTGLVIVSAPEGSDEEDDVRPARLSLKRVDMPAVKKINSTYRMSFRGKPFWDKVFELSTYKKEFTRGSTFLVTPKLGRDTTPEERLEASQLAAAVSQDRVLDNSAAAEQGSAPVEPDAKGGLAV